MGLDKIGPDENDGGTRAPVPAAGPGGLRSVAGAARRGSSAAGVRATGQRGDRRRGDHRVHPIRNEAGSATAPRGRR